jgi:hypothetical protein
MTIRGALTLLSEQSNVQSLLAKPRNCTSARFRNCPNLLGSDQSASAARTQCPGVDRVCPGPGRLTLN